MSESLSAAKIVIARGPAAMTWALSPALRSANDSSERSVSAITSEAIASPISVRTPRSVAVPRSTIDGKPAAHAREQIASARPQGRVCSNRPVRVEEIDELVWTQVLALLEDPGLIDTESKRRLETLRSERPANHRREGLKRDRARTQNALRRLIDGYQEHLITLDELHTA